MQLGQDGECLVQRREPNEKSKTTAAIDRHDFHQCRSDVCWQIRRQARWRHYRDVTIERVKDNRLQCGVGGGVNMVVAQIGANGLSLETDS